MEEIKVTILKWVMDLVQNKRRFATFSSSEEEAARLIRRDRRLTPSQKAVLLSRDPLRIRAVIEYELQHQIDELMMHRLPPISFVIPIPMHLRPPKTKE